MNCPHCGQRMLIRYGVKLSPKLADIFDAIENSKDRGIDLETLSWMFYPDSKKQDAKNIVKVSISHINDLLVETDLRIRSECRYGAYRVVNEKT